jgi:hypothetical protein
MAIIPILSAEDIKVRKIVQLCDRMESFIDGLRILPTLILSEKSPWRLCS